MKKDLEVIKRLRVVAKNPYLHLGDIQIFEAVDALGPLFMALILIDLELGVATLKVGTVNLSISSSHKSKIGPTQMRHQGLIWMVIFILLHGIKSHPS